MERLTERGSSTEPAVREAARLLKLGRELDPPEALRRKIWRELQRGAVKTERTSWALRPAVAMVVVLGVVASAAAFVGHAVWTRLGPARPTPVLPAPDRPRPASSTGVATPSAEPTAAPVPTASTSLPTSQRRAAKARPSAIPPPDEPMAFGAVDPGSQLVQRAMEALRRNRDPRRASVLLDDYLEHYPEGPLFEEGLALAIEAHASLGERRAAILAARYLARFPTGRFRPMAEQAARRFGP